jgi:pre-mRNA-splicing factor ATP-dependent RNA helicase DHX16
MLSVNNAIFYKPKDRAVHAEHAMRNFFRPSGMAAMRWENAFS